MTTPPSPKFWIMKMIALAIIYALGITPPVAYSELFPETLPPGDYNLAKEKDKFLIDTAVADFGTPGIHLLGKPTGPATVAWRDSDPWVAIGGALYLDSFMVSVACAKLVVEFFDRSGSRISPAIRVYDHLANKTTEVTASTWYSECLSNVGAIANKFVWQRRLDINSEDTRIHTIRVRTRYSGLMTPVGMYVDSKLYCADRDGVNGYRVCGNGGLGGGIRSRGIDAQPPPIIPDPEPPALPNFELQGKKP